jgi:hypothetical protein
VEHLEHVLSVPSRPAQLDKFPLGVAAPLTIETVRADSTAQAGIRRAGSSTAGYKFLCEVRARFGGRG